ncbi:MAG: PQQ-binding-like beta-propeller repeat protein [Planctomycetales bacterium]|nr:PQQ-binding-like beta-propeller repeat protein [Planctomycetales bacterium]
MPEQSLEAVRAKQVSLRCFFVAVFFCFLPAVFGFGQYRSRVLVTSPREYQRVLELAQRDIDNAEYANAIERLDKLMNGEGDQSLKEDFFVGPANSARFDASLRSRAEQMLANLPKAARDLYQLQYGAEAQRLLESALSEFDIAKLAEVRRRFGATDAGVIASMVIGRHQLNAQRPMAALLCFERLSQSDPARQKFGAELTLLHAIAARRSGQDEKAMKSLVALKQQLSNGKVTIGQEQVDLFTDDSNAIQWLDEVAGLVVVTETVPVSEWLTHRGDSQRNANAAGSMPLLNRQWTVPVTNPLTDAELIDRLQTRAREHLTPLVPSIQPLITADTAFIRGTQHIVAVNMSNGKRIWSFGDFDHFSGNSGQTASERNTTTEHRLLNDSVYGRLASDGRLLFLVERLNPDSADYRSYQQDPVGRFPQVMPTSAEPNFLIALHIANEGKYHWKVGGKTGEQEPKLAGVFFLGPPIVANDELYVIGDRNNEILLFALEPDTGKLIWSQQLAHSDTRSRYVYMRSPRRTVGAVPSFANGILVCPTSSGAVVAVDVTSRSLLWGYQYPILTNQRRSNRLTSGPVPSGNWLDSTAVIFDGKVLLTPIESDELHCLNLADGSSEWARSLQRTSDKLFVACVYSDVIAIVGKHDVYGVDLKDGQQRWKTSLAEAGSPFKDMPSGYGFRADKHYFLPTMERLLKIDLTNGDIVDAIKCDETLGNIVPYKDHIVSLGLDYLRRYHRQDRLANAVAKKLEESPNDPWALEQHGALLFKEGRVKEGAEAIARAIQVYPADVPERDEAKRLLVSVALAALEENYAKHSALADDIEQWIERPEDRQRYLLVRANGLLTASRPKEALQAFTSLIFDYPRKVAYSKTIIDEKTQHVVRHDRSVRAGVQTALSQLPDADAQSFLAVLQQRALDVLATRDRVRIRRCLDELGTLRVAEPLRVYLAQQLAEDNPAEAEQILLPVLSSNNSDLAAQTHCLLAEIYTTADYYKEAAKLYAIAKSKWPDAQVGDGETVEQKIRKFDATSSVGRQLRTSDTWNYGATSFGTSPRTTVGQRATYTIPVVSQRTSSSLDPNFDLWHSYNTLVVTDRLGRERSRITATMNTTSSSSVRPTTSHQLGTMSLVNLGNVVVAVNNLNAIDPTKRTRRGLSASNVMWPENYNSSTPITTQSAQIDRSAEYWNQEMPFPRNRQIYAIASVSANGIVYLKETQLICVDPLTGEEVWSRNDVKANSRVWGDGEFVFVVESPRSKLLQGEVKSNVARVFHVNDGSEDTNVSIPDSKRIWTTFGRNVLTWDDVPTNDDNDVRNLCLVDPITQTKLWQREFVFSEVRKPSDGDPIVVEGAGCVVDDGFVAIVEPSGGCTVLDVRTGESVGNAVFATGNRKIYRVTLQVSDSQFTVAVLFRMRSERNAQYSYYKPTTEVSLCDGIVHAISRKTGQPLWERPMEVERFGMFDRLPRDLPVMLFARLTRPRSSGQASRSTQRRADIVCVDRRDGRLLFALERQTVPSSEYRVEANSEQSIEFRLPNNKSYRLQYSDHPLAPSPPADVRLNFETDSAGQATSDDSDQSDSDLDDFDFEDS